MVTRTERLAYETTRVRDLWMTWRRHPTNSFDEWLTRQNGVCVAPLLGASDPCSGRSTFDHVHQHSGGTKGKRAPTTPETLV